MGMGAGPAGGGPETEGGPEAELISPGQTEAVYRAIPFKLSLSLEFKNVALVLRELLAQPIAIEITGLNLSRTRQRIYSAGRRGGGEGMTFGEGMGPPGEFLPG